MARGKAARSIHFSKLSPGLTGALGFLLVLLAPGLGQAVTPMDYYNSLVAGGNDAGFKDGAFALARFNGPSGLAMNEGGDELFVADSRNHRIRVVHLDWNNDVETLAGNDTAGATDGPVSIATFNHPTKLAMASGNLLVVYDDGNHSIRLIDLKTQAVSTLAQNLNVADLLYRPQDNSLYFSEPDSRKVEKLDMKSLAVSTVLSNNPLVPSPAALCLYEDNLCVADSNSATIYEVPPPNGPSTVATPAPLSVLGNVNDLLALCSSDGNLYALQRGGFLWKVAPEPGMVKFPTPWGFLFKNQDHRGRFPFLNLPGDRPVGFLASLIEARKFYISTDNSVLSVRDYSFEKYWGAMEWDGRPLTDFDYPPKKPPRTFRILTIGASRNSESVPVPPDPDAPVNEDLESGDPMVSNFSKQLEFMLNTEVALGNRDIHFEVMNISRRGDALSTFACQDVPAIVEKYDIDLVLALTDRSGYKDYYMKPLTSEGIPAQTAPPGYMDKPLSQRAATAEARDILQRLKKLKMPFSEKQDCPGDQLWDLMCSPDPQIRNDMIELTGRRLKILSDKIANLRTSSGSLPQLYFYYVPCADFPNECCDSFYGDLCGRFHLDFFDLSEPYNALVRSYYPTDTNHYTVYGNELIAVLLEHYLIENNLIPFHSALGMGRSQ